MQSSKHVRHGPSGVITRFVATALAALLNACGGGGADEALTSSKATATVVVRAPQGTLLQTTWSAYPRLVRLAHQADPARNGRIVASLTEFDGGVLQAGFHASGHDGATFTRLGTLHDAAFAGGLCCGTLFEMPRTVGALAAGTLLYAASVGQDQTGAAMEHLIFRSDDGGASFHRIAGAACGKAAVPRRPGADGSGVWEPEFLIAADGRLACIYSDETEPGYSQVLKITSTTDGLTWTAPHVIVAGPDATDRPGMAVVRRLPSGRYAMSYERCSTRRLDCTAYLRFSDDGLDWGAPATSGFQPRTADGHVLRHAPTMVWVPTAGTAHGALLLIGQLVSVEGGGVDAAVNGHSMFVDDRGDGSGPWRLVAAPIGLPVAPAVGNWCENYSTQLLPSSDGTGLVSLQTDFDDEGKCLARHGRGALAN
ncbi:MAG TPA: sialidase family protein [Methylibium sp.]|uniref:sialidase family protein n=1 Tax=Methylibium sp. TaxID=2067992 RepID=UPI002DB90558|nr:sialidase family protein [Methylibium sp.]HEU4459826.1 sialidase family protein [Methylibium sp.]